jgi:glyceraldehyde 3-phosphate dehydrogenase
VLRVLVDNFGIENAMFCTVHSYTNDQRLLDSPHKDLRRARAAATSMIPTSTGAAKSTAIVVPEAKGKIQGLAVRVPTPNVSLVDLNLRTEKKTNVDEVKRVLREASQSARWKGVMAYTDEELVSIDFNGSTASSTVDGPSTMMSGDRDIKIISWYDNEVGFSARMIDMALLMGGR